MFRTSKEGGIERFSMVIVMIGHKGLPAHSGGVERHVEGLSKELVRLGVRVISFDRKWYVNHLNPACGVERRWSYGIHTKHLDAITHTLSAIFLSRREKPDVIHFHGVGPSLLIPFARLWVPRAKIVSTFHSTDRYHAKWGWFARTMLHIGELCTCILSHRTIVISENLSRYCLDEYASQAHVIPNGVSISQNADASHLKQFDLKSNSYFAVVARLLPVKNVHVAIEAHALLAKRNADLAKQCPLVIIGNASFTDEYADRVRTMASFYPHVRMIGEQSGETLSALQAHALAHLSVSSVEGMSFSLLGAMAHARPVIVSDIPENTQVVRGDALVTRTNDAVSVSLAMENVLDMREDERRAMGSALQNHTLTYHDWNTIARETMDVYRDALEVAVGESEFRITSFGLRGDGYRLT
jgi:glycosyltransferase involved in cell wall biosynthesis